MDTSDYLALSALIAAVAGVLFNYFHTNRKFQATSIPKLIISHVSVSRRDYMVFKVTNPMADVAISELTLSAAYKLIPRYSILRSFRRWKYLETYEDIEFDEINSSNGHFWIPREERTSFTDHVSHQYPDLLILSNIEGEQVIEILSEFEIDLKLTAIYSPALHHTKKYRTTRYYHLSPYHDSRFATHDRDVLEHWHVE